MNEIKFSPSQSFEKKIFFQSRWSKFPSFDVYLLTGTNIFHPVVVD